MTERRYAQTRATPTLAQRDPDEPTPCHGNSHPFDVLIDKAAGWEYRHALREATSMCKACPVRARCHADNAEEVWVQRLYAGPAREVPSRDCANCGVTFEIGPRQGQKRYCSDACNKAAWRAGVQAV